MAVGTGAGCAGAEAATLAGAELVGVGEGVAELVSVGLGFATVAVGDGEAGLLALDGEAGLLALGLALPPPQPASSNVSSRSTVRIALLA